MIVNHRNQPIVIVVKYEKWELRKLKDRDRKRHHILVDNETGSCITSRGVTTAKPKDHTGGLEAVVLRQLNKKSKAMSSMENFGSFTCKVHFIFLQTKSTEQGDRILIFLPTRSKRRMGQSDETVGKWV